jgi:hypothetical protein
MLQRFRRPFRNLAYAAEKELHRAPIPRPLEREESMRQIPFYSRKKRHPQRDAFFDLGGVEGDRTPDLCNAIAALSQLSYDPVFRMHGMQSEF